MNNLEKLMEAHESIARIANPNYETEYETQVRDLFDEAMGRARTDGLLKLWATIGTRKSDKEVLVMEMTEDELRAFKDLLADEIYDYTQYLKDPENY